MTEKKKKINEQGWFIDREDWRNIHVKLTQNSR